MIYIDLMKIPRPERSGYIAILVSYTLLWLCGYHLMPHNFSDNPKDFSVKCWIAPWACPKEAEPQTTRAELERHYRIVMLSPSGNGKKPCTCHIDLHRIGEPILHLHSRREVTCDSDTDFTPRDWKTIYSYCLNAGKLSDIGAACNDSLTVMLEDGRSFKVLSGKAEYRYHCE